jgi:hypothetical protein
MHGNEKMKIENAVRCDAQPEPESRREFLKTAAAGILSCAAASTATAVAADEARASSAEGRAVQDVLQRFGSEFGAIRGVR